MAKKDTSLEVKKVAGVELPAFMQNEEIMGVESLGEFVIPPRIKIIQKQASDELLATYKPGDIILTPTNMTVLDIKKDNGKTIVCPENSFNIVPLFFYPEWATWNDYKLKGQEPPIRYRTTDPTDPIVAKSRDASLREEDDPDHQGMKIKHLEHLNYIVMIVDHPLEGTPVLLSFSGGEWSQGSKLASLIKMRKASLFGCVFTLNAEHRVGKVADWEGLTPANPANRTPWVDEDKYELYKSLHEEFKSLHKESRLKASLEDETVDADSAATNAAAEEDF